MSKCYSCQTIGEHQTWCVGHISERPTINIPQVPEDAAVPNWTQPGACFFVDGPKEAPKVCNTTVEVKRLNFDKFAALISNQFNHGGDKYKLQGFNDREATDVISSVFGGESEFDWVLGTMMKYLFRFKNFHREKDLLKIATYCYILWLKQGNHLKGGADEDTDR